MPCHVRHMAGLKPGDTLYMLNIGYGSVKKMAQAAAAAVAGRGAGTVPHSPAAGAGAGAEAGEAAGGLNVVYGEVKFPIRCVRTRTAVWRSRQYMPCRALPRIGAAAS